MRRSAAGNATLEMALLTGPLIVVLLFVVGLGRISHGKALVEAAAEDAARAASLERNTAASASAGQSAARRSLGETSLSCEPMQVRVELAAYRPGGEVSATVSCEVSLSDLVGVGFPGSHRYRSTVTVPIEQYRSR